MKVKKLSKNKDKSKAFRRFSYLFIGVTSLSIALVSPGLRAITEDNRDLESIIKIERPTSFNWVDNHQTNVKNVVAPTVTGLIQKRDTTLDDLASLNNKVLTFSPSGFLEVKVGNRVYNLKDKDDTREIFNLLSKYQDFTSETGGLFANDSSINISGNNYADYEYSIADNIELYRRGTYNDVTKGITNTNGETYVISLKKDIKWSDGETITADDFLTKINYYQESEGYLQTSIDKIKERSSIFEGDLSDGVTALENLVSKNLENMVTSLETLEDDIQSKGREYTGLRENEKTDQNFRKVLLVSDAFLNEAKDVWEPLRSFTDFYDTAKKISNDPELIKFTNNEETKTSYTEKANEIVSEIDLIASQSATSVSSLIQDIELLSRTTDRFIKLRWNPISLYGNLTRVLNKTVLLINKTLSFLKSGNSLSKIKLAIEEMRNLKNSALENELDTAKGKLYSQQYSSKRDGSLDVLNLPKALIPIPKGIKEEEIPYFREEWGITYGSDIMDFCSNENTEVTLPLTTKDFIDSNNRIYRFDTKTSFCEQFTLVYEKDGELVFRLVDDLSIDNFLDVLGSSSLLPIKSSLIDKSKDLKEQMFKLNDADNIHISNGPYKIDYINNNEIRYIKNDYYWNKETVFVDSFISRYDTEENRRINKYKKNEEKDLTKEEIEAHKITNYSFEQKSLESERIISNLYSRTASNGFFQAQIGSKINWGEEFGEKIVNNYKLLEDGTCETVISSSLYPDKTTSNYLCGVLPEYRNFHSAIRSILTSTIETHKLNEYHERSWYRPAETIMPTNIGKDSNNKDYLDYVVDSIKSQNDVFLDLSNVAYEDSLKYTFGQALFTKSKRVSFGENLFKANSFQESSSRYSLTGYYHNINKGVDWDYTARAEEVVEEKTPSFNIESATTTWKNILASVPRSWINNLELSLYINKGQVGFYSQFINENWIRNINTVTDGLINFQITTNEEDKLTSDYILSKTYSKEGSILGRFLEFNSNIKDYTLGLSYIQPHLVQYFIINIISQINNDTLIPQTEKNSLVLELNDLKEKLVSTSTNSPRINLLEYLSSNSGLNIDKKLVFLLLSQIEAFYLREGLIIPIQNSFETNKNNVMTRQFLNGGELNINKAFSCLNGEPVITRVVDKKVNQIKLPNCQELALIRELKERLK